MAEIVAVDPIQTGIIRNAFISICDEIGVTMEKAAMSPVIREGKDCCAVMSDGEGDLAAVSIFSQPAFNGTLQYTVKAVIEAIGKENMKPGDLYIVNDPYIAGTHNQDVRVTKPIFVNDEIVAFFTVVGHWTDIGGMVPGTFYMYATEAYQEGIRIPPSLLFRDGKVNEALLNVICANVRMAHASRGDVMAKIASLQTGEARFRELLDKYGVETIKMVMSDYIDYGERMMRQIIAGLPDGSYDWEDYVDQDPGSPQKEPKKFKLTVTIRGDQMTYDLTGSDSPAIGPINSPLPVTFAALFMGTKMIFPEVPYNYGTMRAIQIIIPENSIAWARFPAPVSGMAVSGFTKVESIFLGAFSKIVPERTMACCGNISNLTWGGWDRRLARPRYTVDYCWQEVGWGGMASKDGFQGCQGYLAGGALNIPVEAYEYHSPVIIQGYSLLPDTGGAGKYRGGCGVKRLVEFEFEGVVSAIGDRERFAPWGLFGGKDSIKQSLILNPGTPKENNIGMYCANVPFKPGDTLSFIMAGGGGYGDPLERDPQKVLYDVEQGYVSLEEAGKTYGVVLIEDRGEETYQVDLKATQKLREELKSKA